MTEYIEREAAKDAACDAIELYPSECDVIADSIDKIPAADVAPVVHGRWIMHKPFERDNCNDCIECSDCHTWFGHDFYAKTNYCPHCGVKMDLEDFENG